MVPMTKGATVATRGHKAWLVIGGALLVFASGACSQDKALSTIPTLPPTTSDATVPSTTSDTTLPPPTGGTSPSTDPSVPSTPVPTTPTTEDDLAKLRQEVERDFLRNKEVLFEIAQDPRARNLRQRVAEAVIPGSPQYEQLLKVFEGMIATGQQAVLPDPPERRITVESIELEPTSVPTKALLTACRVDNASVVAVHRTGDTVFVDGRQGVRAYRVVYEMRANDEGWREFDQRPVLDYWPKERRCRDS